MPRVSKYLPYFFMDKAAERAVCGACEKELKCTGRNTKGLQEHLRRLHPELYVSANAHKDECVPDYVHGHKNIGNLRLYLVKWEGYPLADSTYEPVANLEAVYEIVLAYEAQLLIAQTNAPNSQ